MDYGRTTLCVYVCVLTPEREATTGMYKCMSGVTTLDGDK